VEGDAFLRDLESGEFGGNSLEFSEDIFLILVAAQLCDKDKMGQTILPVEINGVDEHFHPMYIADDFTMGVITRELRENLRGKQPSHPLWTPPLITMPGQRAQEYLDIAKKGAREWNVWRQTHPDVLPDFSFSDLSGLDLSKYNLEQSTMIATNLSGANLSGSSLGRSFLSSANFSGCDLSDCSLASCNLQVANLTMTKLNRANLPEANLNAADLSDSDLTEASLNGANLSHATLKNAKLYHTNLEYSNLTDTDFRGATVDSARIYGASIWNSNLEGAVQRNLILNASVDHGPTISVDDLEIGQFIFLLMNNRRIRNAIDNITSKVVLILGRFSPERKTALDAIKEALRSRNYCPILFDFEPPRSRGLTETVATLAHLARFVIVDITEPRSVPHELMAIAPQLPSVPIQPLLQVGIDSEYGMFEHLKRFPWVLQTFEYTDMQHLLAGIADRIIAPAEKAFQALRQ